MDITNILHNEFEISDAELRKVPPIKDSLEIVHIKGNDYEVRNITLGTGPYVTSFRRDASGRKIGSCVCKANDYNLRCKHILGAAQLHVARMRAQKGRMSIGGRKDVVSLGKTVRADKKSR